MDGIFELRLSRHPFMLEEESSIADVPMNEVERIINQIEGQAVSDIRETA